MGHFKNNDGTENYLDLEVHLYPEKGESRSFSYGLLAVGNMIIG